MARCAMRDKDREAEVAALHAQLEAMAQSSADPSGWRTRSSGTGSSTPTIASFGTTSSPAAATRAGRSAHECRFLARDGHVVWVHGEARLVKDAIGRPLFLQGVAFDITDSKNAQ